ncbi:MAG TPA: polysaccharide deacetylase family protein [Thermodesulfobacteriota bacterium]|nr:polysaccharide deacetylase family protein [Thermodesulfobacteriota bacterium]
MEKINALSIDLEEWYHSELVGGRKSSFSQVSEATQAILDLLDRYQTKASFFVVGEVAQQNPHLIQSIFEKGHEIGCHSFSHKLLWKMNESLFRKELEHFHSVMERILGKVKMKGFRAPCFSIDNRCKWALKVLVDFGYQYDASIFPLKINPLYGIRGAPTRPYRISFEDVKQEDPRSPLIEYPFCPLMIGRLKIPISGGVYLRFFPLPFLYWGLRRINRSQPFLVYFHPWEGYDKTPRLRGTPPHHHLILYYGISSVLKKFEFLLKHFRFSRIDHILHLDGKRKSFHKE